MPKITVKFQRGHLQSNRGAVGYHQRFSTNILLHLRNSARQRHSYYGMLIELVCTLSNGVNSSDIIIDIEE